MDHDRDRILASGGLLPREVDPSGNLAAIETLPGDQLWLDKTLRWNAASLARGPAFQLAALNVDRIDIRRRLRRVELKAQISIVLVPA